MDDTEHETMSRAETAQYLSLKGWRGQTSTLAKYAVEGTGPPFTKDTDGRSTIYKKADVDAWLAAGGQKQRGPGGRPSHRKAKADDLEEVLDEFVPLVERVAIGQGTFQDGVRFGQALDRLKRAMRYRRNGAH